MLGKVMSCVALGGATLVVLAQQEPRWPATRDGVPVPSMQGVRAPAGPAWRPVGLPESGPAAHYYRDSGEPYEEGEAPAGMPGGARTFAVALLEAYGDPAAWPLP